MENMFIDVLKLKNGKFDIYPMHPDEVIMLGEKKLQATDSTHSLKSVTYVVVSGITYILYIRGVKERYQGQFDMYENDRKFTNRTKREVKSCGENNTAFVIKTTLREPLIKDNLLSFTTNEPLYETFAPCLVDDLKNKYKAAKATPAEDLPAAILPSDNEEDSD